MELTEIAVIFLKVLDKPLPIFQVYTQNDRCSFTVLNKWAGAHFAFLEEIINGFSQCLHKINEKWTACTLPNQGKLNL
jgi:hypothetical protein